MRVLLTASWNESNGMIAAIARISSKRVRAAVVTTASVEYKEKNRNAIAARAAIKSTGFSQVIYFDFDHDNPEALASFDLVYLSGGNPHYLLMRIMESNADVVLLNLAKQGVPIIGASAGGLVLGSSTAQVDVFDPGLSDYGYAGRQGLGIVPFSILPHSNRWKIALGQEYEKYLDAARLACKSELQEIPDGHHIFIKMAPSNKK